MRPRSPRRCVCGAGRSMRGGFTLIELLIVIAILALLASLLFPVLAQARASARAVVCSSNMRQTGIAISLYAADYDGYYPVAVDPADRFTPQIWNGIPEFKALIPELPWLHEVLLPYVKSKELFHCPSDIGMKIEDFTGFELDGLPTLFGRWGSSYLYRTEIAARHFSDSAFQSPAEINVYMDGGGLWHGTGPTDEQIGVGHFFEQNPMLFARRYNTLHGDGHMKNHTFTQVWKEWHTPL